MRTHFTKIAVGAVICIFIFSFFPLWHLIVGLLLWLLAIGVCLFWSIKIIRHRHSKVKKIIGVSSAVIIIMTGLMIPCGWYLFNQDFLKAKVHLYYCTDKEQLLKDCRMMMKNRKNYKTNRPDMGSGRDLTYIELAWKDYTGKQLSDTIAKLCPAHLRIADNYMIIVLFSGHYHLSVAAYPEGVTGNGDKKLADGLWITEN